MDTLRFEELKHSITYGGLPDVSREIFVPAQVAELKTILEARAQQCTDYLVSLTISKEETEKANETTKE